MWVCSTRAVRPWLCVICKRYCFQKQWEVKQCSSTTSTAGIHSILSPSQKVGIPTSFIPASIGCYSSILLGIAMAGSLKLCFGGRWSVSWNWNQKIEYITRHTRIWKTWSYYIPSGKRLQNYGKSQSLMGQLTISMSIFKIYVKLPEGSTITCSNIVVHESNEREREREIERERDRQFLQRFLPQLAQFFLPSLSS